MHFVTVKTGGRKFRCIDCEVPDPLQTSKAAKPLPGFDRLVAWLSAGKVSAVLCFGTARLARNGRDWHHLVELCGLVEARVVDLDDVYNNPCQPMIACSLA
jgi:DNA invertase Pin-like site-specific DNA recombinase